MQHATADLRPDPLNPDGQFQGSPLPDTTTIHDGHDRWEDVLYARLAAARRSRAAPSPLSRPSPECAPGGPGTSTAAGAGGGGQCLVRLCYGVFMWVFVKMVLLP